LYILLNPLRPFVTVKLPSGATDARIQLPMQSAVSSRFAI
jgi:hypothetical protein